MLTFEHIGNENRHGQLESSLIPIRDILLKLLDHENPAVRHSALAGLRLAHELSFDTIKHTLNDMDGDVRQEALYALLPMGINQTTAPYLVTLFEDARGSLSTAAINALSRPSQMIDAAAVMVAIMDVLIARSTGLPEENFNPEIAVTALQKTIDLNPQLHGQALRRLCDLAYEHSGRIRRRAVFVAKGLDTEEFRELVNERAQQNPEAAKEINRLTGVVTDTTALVKQLSEADPGDVQTIAASQIGLLQSYYQDALAQSKASFRWALISEAVGLICLVLTLIYLLATQSQSIVGVLTAVGSVLTQFIAAAQFVLYREARQQVAYYHQQLDQTQRFLLANSVCESLDGDAKQNARIELIRAIAAIALKQDGTPQPPEKK
jgi:HEAT repeat protein